MQASTSSFNNILIAYCSINHRWTLRGWTTLLDSVLSTPTPAPTLLQLSKNSVSPAWPPPCRTFPLLLTQMGYGPSEQPPTMSSSNVQSIDLTINCTAWRFGIMRQLNGCSTPAPRSSAAKQWIAATGSNDDDARSTFWCQVRVFTKVGLIRVGKRIFS